jgi:hypothetical protein
MNRDKWDAMNDGPYRINQDALLISFVTFHNRRAHDQSAPIKIRESDQNNFDSVLCKSCEGETLPWLLLW